MTKLEEKLISLGYKQMEFPKEHYKKVIDDHFIIYDTFSNSSWAVYNFEDAELDAELDIELVRKIEFERQKDLEVLKEYENY